MENKEDDETDSDEEYIDYFTWLDENRRQSKRLCLENRRGKFYEHTNQFLNNFHTIVPVLGDYLVLEDVIQLIKLSKGLKTFMYETRSPAMKDFWNLLGIRFFPNCKVKHGLVYQVDSGKPRYFHCSCLGDIQLYKTFVSYRLKRYDPGCPNHASIVKVQDRYVIMLQDKIYQAARMKAFAPPADAQGGSTADDVAETGSADDVALVAGPTPSLGAPSVPIVETAAIGACRETRAAARRKAINQAAVAPSADAHSGLTADCPSADLSLIFKSALQKSLKRMAARGIQPFALYSNLYCLIHGHYLLRLNILLGDTGPRYEQLKRQADKAWNVGRVAPRKPKNIFTASYYNIPRCGVKYPKPRRNPLKRRKLE